MHENIQGFGAKMAHDGETLVCCLNYNIQLRLTTSIIFGRDILHELATTGDLPLPEASPTNKRERDSDTPKSSSSGESPQPVTQEDGPRIIAGSRRVNKDRSG